MFIDKTKYNVRLTYSHYNYFYFEARRDSLWRFLQRKWRPLMIKRPTTLGTTEEQLPSFQSASIACLWLQWAENQVKNNNIKLAIRKE